MNLLQAPPTNASRKKIGLNGGPGTDIRYSIVPTSLGHLLVAGTDRGVCAIRLDSSRAGLESGLKRDFPGATIRKADADFTSWVKALVAEMERPTGKLKLPLDIQGTAFQHRVWQALRDIPIGDTVSYTELAKRIGHPRAVRAVANACGANPVAVIIPCHRVIGSNGGLTGYRWGVARKQALLERESALKL